VERFGIDEAARRAGVSPEFVAHVHALGLVDVGDDRRVAEPAIRRLTMLHHLDVSGLPLDGIAQLVAEGAFSLDFIEVAGSEAFAPFGERTFAEESVRSGIPVELLMTIREASGGLPPAPDDRMRDDELAVAGLVAFQVEDGFRAVTIERTLRVYGDSLRRIAETEGEWWRSEIQDRLIAAARPRPTSSRTPARTRRGSRC
jgi:hypothetical protein